ncbi:hypothetical protein NLG97_g9658 [Lecanicillium saksenae]|uniref:Uncharacterized protein n=1 Tax=Lecanicillium saksenae TaxID=468837 RepID=A0ACC1QFD7_9HYPO|nr:hypothetical protein NLG97_g9658 [Lecanicillium saksenae]
MRPRDYGLLQAAPGDGRDGSLAGRGGGRQADDGHDVGEHDGRLGVLDQGRRGADAAKEHIFENGEESTFIPGGQRREATRASEQLIRQT